MGILTHTFFVIILLVVSADISGVLAPWLYQLELPGAKLVVISPIIVALIYILGAALGGYNKKGRLVWILIPLFMAYPVMIFKCFSQKVETSTGYRSEDYHQFESEYGKPMMIINDSIYVAKKNYDDGLAERLREIVAHRQETTEQDGADKPTTAPKTESDGSDNPNPESKERTQ